MTQPNALVIDFAMSELLINPVYIKTPNIKNNENNATPIQSEKLTSVVPLAHPVNFSIIIFHSLATRL